MAVATNTTRYAFAPPASGWINTRLGSLTGVSVGTVLTFARPAFDQGSITATVQRILPNNGVYAQINSFSSSSRPSGIQLLPKGTVVTG